MDVIECIKTRRSIRKFLTKDIPWETVSTIIDCGRRAPCAGNLQNLKFILVNDQAKRSAIAECSLQQYWMQNAPIYVIIVAEPDKAKKFYGLRGERLYTIQNCAAAAENIILAAQHFGLGSCWVGAFDEDKVKSILGINGTERPQIIIPIGYPAENPPEPARTRLYHTLYLNKWSNQSAGKIDDMDQYMEWYGAKNRRALEKLKNKVVEKIKGK